MKVRHDEGIANRIGPEPCAGAREGVGEASVGECIGQPLSRERVSRVPTWWITWKAIRTGAPSQAPERPGVVRDPGMCRRSLRGNPGGLASDRLAEAAGPHRGGEEP